MKLTLYLYLVPMITLLSCNSKTKALSVDDSNNSRAQEMASLNIDEANMQLEAFCYTCHNPTSESHDDMMAPPLAAIKHKYKTTYPEREVFVSKMVDFVLYPTKQKAIMPGPVNRFGLMPKSVFTEEKLKLLVGYIYDNALPVPDWFPEHFEKMHGETWAD